MRKFFLKNWHLSGDLNEDHAKWRCNESAKPREQREIPDYQAVRRVPLSDVMKVPNLESKEKFLTTRQ